MVWELLNDFNLHFIRKLFFQTALPVMLEYGYVKENKTRWGQNGRPFSEQSAPQVTSMCLKAQMFDNMVTAQSLGMDLQAGHLLCFIRWLNLWLLQLCWKLFLQYLIVYCRDSSGCDWICWYKTMYCYFLFVGTRIFFSNNYNMLIVVSSNGVSFAFLAFL